MKRFVLAACLLMLGACSTYTTPGAGVSLAAISDVDIAEAMSRQPAITFPARLAVARVAAVGYRSGSNDSIGSGAYAIVTTRDIETDPRLQRPGPYPRIAPIPPV